MKILSKFFCIIIFLSLLSFFVLKNVYVKADCTWYTTSKEVINVGYGVTIDKIIGHGGSTYNTEDSYIRNQVIHTANVPKDSPARVVQWSKYGMTDNYWGTYTLDMIAEDYERKHPNEKVLVATNNWLNYHTTRNPGEICGPQIAGGLNYRVSKKSGTPNDYLFSTYLSGTPNILGFKSSGKEIVFDSKFEPGVDYTENLMISFFDSATYEKTPLGFEITKVNEEPNEGEISIFFNNYGGDQKTFNGAKIIKMMGICLRHDTRVSTTPVERDVFALGTFDSVVDELYADYNTAGYYAYHIVSKNDEFNKIDLSNNEVLVQHELIGDFEDVIGGTCYIEMLVKDGVMYGDFKDPSSYDKAYHPRTVFIEKEDGSLALSVIDGRQIDMIGMDYEEMAYFYKTNYDAYQVFNYDGGGSSCMIAANSNGGFDVLNSPSDGSVRRVANATLVVVDKEPFEISQGDPHESIIRLNVNNIDSSVTKIIATLNDVSKEVIDGKVEFENLNPNTNYSVLFTYVQDEVSKQGSTYNVKTSKKFAELSYFEAIETTQNSTKIIVAITNEQETFDKAVLTVNGVSKEITTTNETIEFNNLNYLTEYNCEIKVYSKTYTKYVHEIIYNKTFKTTEAKYPEKIVIGEVNTSLYVGDEVQLYPDSYPSGMIKNFRYESSDQSIIKVSFKGKVEALKEGTATVRVYSSDGLETTITFNVSIKQEEKSKGCKRNSIISFSLISCLGVLLILKKEE